MRHHKSLLKKLFIFFVFSASISCDGPSKEKHEQPDHVKDSLLLDNFQETYRPQFHFSPKANWMNDPNGMVYYKGVYHLFYQYFPDGTVWGPMHWGHATSKDLIHWQHQGIKLFPDEHGYIFSGSAVVDHQNSSGLGTAESPPLVAIFTYHDAKAQEEGSTDYQTQGIAYSNDNGVTWEKYTGNPVLKNPGDIDFRDPKVIWHEATQKWVMALAVGDHISFYGSKDLINWQKLSDFGKDMGAHGGVWECPDLFPMPVQGTEEIKWVLLVSINPGGPNGGSATQFFVGSFDGIQFKPDDHKTRWIDFGMDNYAGVTFSNAPDNEKIFLGWMSNWFYAQETPTSPWRSAMTLPRTLSLLAADGNYYLQNTPIKAFKELRTEVLNESLLEVKDSLRLKTSLTDQTEVIFHTALDKTFSVKLSNDLGEHMTLQIDPDQQQISFDRTNSGLTTFNENFANKIHILPYVPVDSMKEIRIIVDRSSVEIFIDKGRYVMTEQVFPTQPYAHLDLISEEQLTLKELKINHVKSIWKDE